jgi:hypothetical protein
MERMMEVIVITHNDMGWDNIIGVCPADKLSQWLLDNEYAMDSHEILFHEKELEYFNE